MAKDLVKTDQPTEGSLAFVATKESIELIKTTVAAEANLTDNELQLFLYQAKRTGLDPLARQIYVMKSGGYNGKDGKISFLTSIDGQRLIAQRTGEYRGQVGPEWCGPDGKWKDVWLDSGNPAACRVGVLREGFTEPVYGIATWKSYGKQKGVWTTMGDIMIAKCAEALAFRKAFPQELAGMYTAEEMDNTGVVKGEDQPPARSAADLANEINERLDEIGVANHDKRPLLCEMARKTDFSQLNGRDLMNILDTLKRATLGDLTSKYKTFKPEAPAKPAEKAPVDDDEMPAGFLQPDEGEGQGSDEPDNTNVTDEEIDSIESSIPESDPEPKYIIPEFKRGNSTLPRPEMRKLANQWLEDLGLTTKTAANNFLVSALGKKEATTFDDFELLLGVLADELNAKEKQTSLV